LAGGGGGAYLVVTDMQNYLKCTFLLARTGFSMLSLAFGTSRFQPFGFAKLIPTLKITTTQRHSLPFSKRGHSREQEVYTKGNPAHPKLKPNPDQ